MKDPLNIEADKSNRPLSQIIFYDLTCRYQTILSHCRLFSIVGRAFAIITFKFITITRMHVSCREAEKGVPDNHLSDLIHSNLYDLAGDAEVLGKEVTGRREEIKMTFWYRWPIVPALKSAGLSN